SSSKSAGFKNGPRWSATTRKPAAVSSWIMTPPPAPVPITHTSNSSLAMFSLLRRQWRLALVPLRRALVGLARTQHGHLVERTPDELETSGEPSAREAAGQRGRGQACRVEWRGAADHRHHDRLLGAAVVYGLLADPGGDDGRGRREQQIDRFQRAPYR